MNIFSDISIEDFREMLDSANTVSEIVVDKFGLSKIGGNYKTLKREAIKRDLLVNYENLAKRGIKFASRRQINKNTVYEIHGESEIFILNSKVDVSSIRRWILRNNLLEYKCRDCECVGDWNGKKLTLQLEHINGNNKDQRLENLCFLCPNCHSQTDTYGSKNKVNKKNLG